MKLTARSFVPAPDRSIPEHLDGTKALDLVIRNGELSFRQEGH
jgi:hypothetical protein